MNREGRGRGRGKGKERVGELPVFNITNVSVGVSEGRIHSVSSGSARPPWEGVRYFFIYIFFVFLCLRY